MSRDSRCVALVTGANLGSGWPGGTRSYVLGLARFLVRDGLRVVLVSNGHVEDAPSECEIRAVREVHQPSSVRFQRDLRGWATSENIRGIDLFHFQRADDLAALGRKAGFPVAVCTLHGDATRGIRRRYGVPFAWAYARREARVLPLFRAIIVVDPRTAQVYQGRFPSLSDRIVVIPNAIDDAWFAAAAPSDGPSSREGPALLLFAGRLSIEKRVDRIIQAIRNSPDLKDATLLIAGSGREEARLRALADGCTVQFLGNVAPSELLALYRRADALVLASEFEGCPTVVIEALAAGCPVVALAGSGVEPLFESGDSLLAQDERDLPRALRSAIRVRRQGPPVRRPWTHAWSSVGPQILEQYRRVWRQGTE